MGQIVTAQPLMVHSLIYLIHAASYPKASHMAASFIRQIYSTPVLLHNPICSTIVTKMLQSQWS
jgi:hypothetical protein